MNYGEGDTDVALLNFEDIPRKDAGLLAHTDTGKCGHVGDETYSPNTPCRRGSPPRSHCPFPERTDTGDGNARGSSLLFKKHSKRTRAGCSRGLNLVGMAYPIHTPCSHFWRATPLMRPARTSRRSYHQKLKRCFVRSSDTIRYRVRQDSTGRMRR